MRWRPFFERLVDKFEPKSDGCWEWTAATAGKYGVVHYNSRQQYAHRVTYQVFVGPIPEGLTIDHLCRNTRCVNPDHLEAVTMRENVLRGETVAAHYASATHCKWGHEFTPANTYLPPGRTGLHRMCRECLRRRAREAYHRKKIT